MAISVETVLKLIPQMEKSIADSSKHEKILLFLESQEKLPINFTLECVRKSLQHTDERVISLSIRLFGLLVKQNPELISHEFTYFTLIKHKSEIIMFGCLNAIEYMLSEDTIDYLIENLGIEQIIIDNLDTQNLFIHNCNKKIAVTSLNIQSKKSFKSLFIWINHLLVSKTDHIALCNIIDILYGLLDHPLMDHIPVLMLHSNRMVRIKVSGFCIQALSVTYYKSIQKSIFDTAFSFTDEILSRITASGNGIFLYLDVLAKCQLQSSGSFNSEIRRLIVQIYSVCFFKPLKKYGPFRKPFFMQLIQHFIQIMPFSTQKKVENYKISILKLLKSLFDIDKEIIIDFLKDDKFMDILTQSDLIKRYFVELLPCISITRLIPIFEIENVVTVVLALIQKTASSRSVGIMLKFLLLNHRDQSSIFPFLQEILLGNCHDLKDVTYQTLVQSTDHIEYDFMNEKIIPIILLHLESDMNCENVLAINFFHDFLSNHIVYTQELRGEVSLKISSILQKKYTEIKCKESCLLYIIAEKDVNKFTCYFSSELFSQLVNHEDFLIRVYMIRCLTFLLSEPRIFKDYNGLHHCRIKLSDSSRLVRIAALDLVKHILDLPNNYEVDNYSFLTLNINAEEEKNQPLKDTVDKSYILGNDDLVSENNFLCCYDC